MQNAPRPTAACISLVDKVVPTELLSEEARSHTTIAAFLGYANIGKIKKKLDVLNESYWGGSLNNNASLERPFHDKLGVKKIITIFSDTMIQNVFYLPAWDEWRDLLVPIFSGIGIDVNQVVRCLFARMPPGVTIPPHHDNGLWVSKTHRIHVPITTDKDVEFHGGATIDSMTRFAFDEGTVIELNNAAKHSVYNGSNRHRIHLIFDYVEPQHLISKENAIFVKQGQRCKQVRGRVEIVDSVSHLAEKRSMDEANRALQILVSKIKFHYGQIKAEKFSVACRHYFIEQITARCFCHILHKLFYKYNDSRTQEIFNGIVKSCVKMLNDIDVTMASDLTDELQKPWNAPSYIIIGAQKCGTTALYEYISQHSLVVKGKRREPHYFDWQWDKAKELKLNDKQSIIPRQILEHDIDYETLSKENREMREKYLYSFQYPLVELMRPNLIGESTPSYLLYGTIVADRIKSICPSVKLLVILRNPVSRAFSHYKMTSDNSGTPEQLQRRLNVRGSTFEQVIEQDMELLKNASISPESPSENFQSYANKLPIGHGCHSYIGRGLYAMQLEQWYKVFPRDQILVLCLEDMDSKAAIQTELEKTFEFLGVSNEPIYDTSVKNSRQYEKMPDDLKASLEAFYAPYNQRLYKLIGRNLNWL